MKIINSKKAPAAIGPYSQAINAGNTIYVSGQLPINQATNSMPECIKEQTLQSLTNIKYILEEAGYPLTSIVKMTIFLDNINDFQAVNEVYGKFLGEHKPARACIEVAKIPKGALIEIDAIACK
ncbi:MAG: RidA family protein [Mycoplasmoidaceae bacterium]